MDRPLASLGILGGTFNPPHLGHLELARHARDELDLLRVVLMPAHIAPHKSAEQDPGVEHRLAMSRLLVGGEEGLSVCGLELERPGASYTVDTLERIHASEPDSELTFIVGADIARTLPAWREPARVLELARLAIAERDGTSSEEVLETIAALRSGGERSGNVATRGDLEVSFLRMPVIEVSSSSVRGRVERGEAVDQLVGPRVARYIAEHGLYRSGAGGNG
ncbi:MAG TPA: nicotinate-nucleotide adenylyltransferase [Solirubrobacteraceae bacterium]|nr:nicotinate-nucleotide adenylyltransferase [Solirubrobacteraceae bacterium]